MNTPRTDAVGESLVSEYEQTDFNRFIRMINHAEQLERELTAEQEKVRELREALSILEQQIDYGQVDVALDYVRAILEKTK